MEGEEQHRRCVCPSARRRIFQSVRSRPRHQREKPWSNTGRGQRRSLAPRREALKWAIEKRLDFSFETTLGGNTITKLLLKAAEQGTEVHVWYEGLSSPELHIARVRARVSRGGHDIPAHDIHRRYEHSRLNLIAQLPLLTPCTCTTTASMQILQQAEHRC